MLDGRVHRDLISVGADLRRHLKREIKRTGVNAQRLLSVAADCPEGLNSSAVNRWIGGIAKHAPENHVSYVKARWAAMRDDAGRISDQGKRLPSRGRRHQQPGETWIDVTADMAAFLRAEFGRTGLDSQTVLAGGGDLPDLLTPRTIIGWLYQETKTADAAAWDFVVSRLRAAPDGPPLPSLPLRKPRKPKPSV